MKECPVKRERLVESLSWRNLAQWAAAVAEILAVAAILAMAFTAGNYIAAQRAALQAASSTNPVGVFEAHGDVGAVLHEGSVEYDAAKQTYTLTGSGYNIWFEKDAFQFAWRKETGDVTLEADISFLGTGGNEHRKAVLMIRESLDADSAYADIALHGNGMTALQTRDEKGALTHEVKAVRWHPKQLRLE